MSEVCGYQHEELPSLGWMPSRIPVRDALVAFVAENAPPPELPYESGESRWFPVSGGLRLAIPYDGQSFDPSIFHVEKGLWDHTTCANCSVRVASMTLCYVTERGNYVEFCVNCYSNLVVAKLPMSRKLIWRIKRLFGNEDSA